MLENVSNEIVNVSMNVTNSTSVVSGGITNFFTVPNLLMACGILLLCSLVLYFLISMSGKYFWFGIKLARMCSKLGSSNVGFAFLRNKSNNFDLPEIIDLQNYKLVKKKPGKEDTFVYAREQLEIGKFFGFPYVIFDDDDNKTSIGLYYHHSDKDGNPLYQEIVVGTDDKTGKVTTRKIPLLAAVKPAVTLPPDFYKVLVDSDRLRKAMHDFLENYKTLLYCIAGVGIVALAVVVIVWTIHDKDVPQVLNYCSAALDACRSIQANFTSFSASQGVILR